MLLNSFTPHYVPTNSTMPNTDNSNTRSNIDNQNNSNQQQNQRYSTNALSRLFRNCGCNNQDDDNGCCPNRGISLSTILFFVLIFLILFYND